MFSLFCTRNFDLSTSTYPSIQPAHPATHPSQASTNYKYILHFELFMVSLYSAKKGFLLNVVMVIHVLAFVFSDHWVNRRSQFTFMGHGDFLLYKNTERNFEVKCAFRFIVRTLNRNCVFIARFQQGCEAWEIKQKKLSFVAIFFSFSLAKSSPRDLQISAHK